MSSSKHKHSRKLPSWMLEDATDTKSPKRHKSSPKTTPTKTTTTPKSKKTNSPTSDPLEIYKTPTKPVQDPHQRLQEIFKSTLSPNKPIFSSPPKHSPISPASSTKSSPSPVKYNNENISPRVSPGVSPKVSPKISPKTTPEKSTISPVRYKISPTQLKKTSPGSVKRRNLKTNSSSEEDELPKSSNALGHSPLRSPELSPDRSTSPSHFDSKPLLSETEIKRVLEKDKSTDNDSNYSSGSDASGKDNGSEKSDSGSENELNDEENDDFEFFANSDSIFSPLPSPDISSSSGGSSEIIEQETKSKRSSTFICDHPCSKKLEYNKNKQLTDALENIQKLHYLYGEQWQELSMRKAITALKRYPNTITHISQVKDIHGIGSSITTKIAAFLDGKPISAKGPPQLELFGNVWGAGPKSVKSWISKGYTTLEQLLRDPDLTPEQRVGVKYYSAFRTRIPRKEVEEHVAKVAEVVKQMPSSVTASVVAAGSYRRGREDCGDIDVLVMHPSSKPTGVLQELINKLHKTNFLVDDLQLSQVKNRDWAHHFDKYMGVSSVGGLPRRIDIMVVPAGSHAATLLYMTGSAYFNRSLRLKSKKNGFYLCNHAVARADINGKRVGPPIPVHSEEEIFALLSTPYQPPHARDW